METYLIDGVERDRVAVERTRGLSRLRGLAFRRELENGCALLFTRCRSVHSCLMRHPIDVVFVDREFVVLSVRLLRPWRAVVDRRAHAVLEFRAGEIRRLGIEPGKSFCREGGQSTPAQPLDKHGRSRGSRPDPDRGRR